MHTPGPWDRTAIYWMIRHATKQMIEIPGDKDMAIPSYSNSADMDLIAAAPDQNEALKAVAADIEKHGRRLITAETLRMVCDAIHKAEPMTGEGDRHNSAIGIHWWQQLGRPPQRQDWSDPQVRGQVQAYPVYAWSGVAPRLTPYLGVFLCPQSMARFQ